MTVKNISSKIISIGSIALMPDDEATIDAKTAKLPSLLALESMKLISITDDSVKPTATTRGKKAKSEAATTKTDETTAKTEA